MTTKGRKLLACAALSMGLALSSQNAEARGPASQLRLGTQGAAAAVATATIAATRGIARVAQAVDAIDHNSCRMGNTKGPSYDDVCLQSQTQSVLSALVGGDTSVAKAGNGK